MSDLLVPIKIKESDKDRIFKECKTEFLKNHPELKGMRITYNFMITQIIEWYLK